MKLTDARSEKQLKSILNLYLSAFPKNEQKPFELILKKRDEGAVEILSIEDDEGEFLGLAIMILHGELALLDYFAVAENSRGEGIGTAALNMLQRRYDGKKFFLEIETTKSPAPNHAERVRRKNFYCKNSMSPMDYTVELFGVEMEIMTYNCTVGFEEYHKIFSDLFSKQAAEKVRLL